MVQNLIYKKAKKVGKAISTKLVMEAIRKIASEMRGGLEKASCRAAQGQGVHINTTLIHCNIDVGTLLERSARLAESTGEHIHK